ncbi:hypothetical protein [Pseudomonas akapageensis]|uniref:hypothetical protein n=1 Tax=Pseudomonas akapageensis TaxID=2609961 RepID=UPI00140B057C|nr:hypothetical protein [Pseudomonas akapageensis]
MGISTATLHRIAKKGGFLFKVSTSNRGHDRAPDPAPYAAKLERLKALRDVGLSRNQVAKQMDVSNDVLIRLIETYEVDFPIRQTRK